MTEDGYKLVGFAHELSHAWIDVCANNEDNIIVKEIKAVRMENQLRFSFFTKVPGYTNLFPRSGVRESNKDIANNAKKAWNEYNSGYVINY